MYIKLVRKIGSTFAILEFVLIYFSANGTYVASSNHIDLMYKFPWQFENVVVYAVYELDDNILQMALSGML